jgi:serine/threonine-protein kinase
MINCDCLNECRQLVKPRKLAVTVVNSLAKKHKANANTVSTAPTERVVGQTIYTSTGFEYTIERCLGTGGQGIVYLASRGSDQATVALKIAKQAGASIESRLISDEYAALARLNHPHVVKVIEYGKTREDECYVALEVVDGITLESLLGESNHLHEYEIVNIGLQIADAMEHAHLCGVVHGDLKPGNIMISQAAETKKIYVIDFGISHILEDPEDQSDEFNCGSISYMSPEQMAGLQITNKSDIYQLGLILYECLFGGLPPGDTKSDIVAAKAADNPPFECPDQVYMQWQDFFGKTLSTKPETRYPSMRHVKKELRKLADKFLPPVNTSNDAAAVQNETESTNGIESLIGL